MIDRSSMDETDPNAEAVLLMTCATPDLNDAKDVCRLMQASRTEFAWLVALATTACILACGCARGFVQKNQEIKKLEYKLKRVQDLGIKIAAGEDIA